MADVAEQSYVVAPNQDVRRAVRRLGHADDSGTALTTVDPPIGPP